MIEFHLSNTSGSRQARTRIARLVDRDANDCAISPPPGWTIDDLVRDQSRDDDIAAFIAMKKVFDKERPPATSIYHLQVKM